MGRSGRVSGGRLGSEDVDGAARPSPGATAGGGAAPASASVVGWDTGRGGLSGAGPALDGDASGRSWTREVDESRGRSTGPRASFAASMTPFGPQPGTWTIASARFPARSVT